MPPSQSPHGWQFHRRSGTASYLHGLDLLGGGATIADAGADTGASVESVESSARLSRSVWLLEPTAPAVVLGSAQRFGEAGTPVHGTEVVMRRSGGGAVVLEPGVSVWVDVVLPRHDVLWNDDVSRSTQWLGQVWVAALASLGVEASVHDGPTDRHPMARAACFAGLGSGEVIGGGGKLVGISQRRTRAGARFQCVAYTAQPRVDAMVDLVGAGADTEGLAEVLARRTGIVPVESMALTDAVCRAIMLQSQLTNPMAATTRQPEQ